MFNGSCTTCSEVLSMADVLSVWVTLALNVSVRFHLPDPELEAMFRADARRNGLNHLEGHPSVGGLRASLYNLVTLEAVETLAEFMTEFERVRG